MSTKFWVLRFIKVFLGVLVFLFAVHLIKGHSTLESLSFAAFWALTATSIFVGSRIYQSRKGIACELCNDIPNKNAEVTSTKIVDD